MSAPIRPDPAYWMSKQAAPKRAECYICQDEEFSLMGLPLCYACEKCKGHVPADDTVCSDCGHNDDERGRSDDDD